MLGSQLETINDNAVSFQKIDENSFKPITTYTMALKTFNVMIVIWFFSLWSFLDNYLLIFLTLILSFSHYPWYNLLPKIDSSFAVLIAKTLMCEI